MRGRIIIFAALLLATPASAQVVIYDSNPRIIRVPEGNARHVAPVAHTMSDDELIERIERRKAQPRRPLAKPVTDAPRPRAELPPPASESRRAVLTAPPPAVGPGSLTPIYPTPRWRNADPPPPISAENNE
jgi:hypothetical protein